MRSRLIRFWILGGKSVRFLSVRCRESDRCVHMSAVKMYILLYQCQIDPFLDEHISLHATRSQVPHAVEYWRCAIAAVHFDQSW